MPTQAMPPTWTAAPLTQTQMADPSRPTATALPATPSGPLCGRTGVTNVLVIGADARADSYLYGLGDAIRLVRVDFSNQKVSALEFPRDLWVEIPHIADNLNGQDHEKLNQAYLYGQPGFKYWDDPSEGSGLTALTLNRNFNASIDNYITVNMRTFEKIINAIGGIEVVIPNEDVAKTANLSVGTHTLNGAQALKLARNRSGGIFERADNQNLVLCAVRKKLTSPQIVTEIPALIETFQDNIRTDLTPEQLAQFACLATQTPPENIVLTAFPGDLFRQTRVYDPVFEKRISILDADFAILTDFVLRFQMGTWPIPSPADENARPDEDAPVICE
jgi:LCP family protein required for cell wall assembly